MLTFNVLNYTFLQNRLWHSLISLPATCPAILLSI